jgi:uncharacterized ubiquitin-like protein YukD
MTFYTSLQETASALIRDKGQLVNVTGYTAGAYDLNTGTTSPTGAFSQLCYAVVLDYSGKDIDGTFIKRGDKKVLLEAKNILAPSTTSKISIGGILYTVIACYPINPAGTTVIYKIQARV